MNSIITNFQVGATSEIAPRFADKLNEMSREAGYVKEESRFFIRLLNQSKYYSEQNKKKEIESLAKNFDAFLSDDQKNMEQLIKGELKTSTQKDDQSVIAVNQKWHSFTKKFRKLKGNAMALLGDFFVVRFE